jgi:soluble lytic murein transglycosylase-like protein
MSAKNIGVWEFAGSMVELLYQLNIHRWPHTLSDYLIQQSDFYNWIALHKANLPEVKK